jgi:hypothetical protein
MTTPLSLGPVHVKEVNNHNGIFTEVHGDLYTNYNIAMGSETGEKSISLG